MGHSYKTFRNREHAAEELSRELIEFKGLRPLVLGIPRGAMPMARIVADRLDGDLDVILVHKVSRLTQPEFAVASVSEEGDILMGEGGRRTGMTLEDVEPLAKREIEALKRKRALFLPNRERINPAHRIAIIVDDGIATGATMEAAVKSLIRQNAKRVIVATPVASQDAAHRLRESGVETRILLEPEVFFAVGQFYEEFDQVSDEDVIASLQSVPQEVEIDLTDGSALGAVLNIPRASIGLIIFAHGSGSGRHSPRNRFVAEELNEFGFSTILADLLTIAEESDRSNVFDIPLLASRLGAIADWASHHNQLKHLPIGLFGASTGAAAALECASLNSDRISAVVSRGGRPDLAAGSLEKVEAPTLLIVGGLDTPVIGMNQSAYSQLNCEKKIEIVPGATHLFEEPGALEQVAKLARQWFLKHLPTTPKHKLIRSPHVERPGEHLVERHARHS